MAKPDVTLEPSQGVVSQMAAWIYAAYIIRGAVKDGEEANWMQRSIREAVRIAKTVGASVDSEDESGPGQHASPGEAPAAAASSVAEPAGLSAPSPSGSSAAASADKALQDPQFDEVVEQTLAAKSRQSARP